MALLPVPAASREGTRSPERRGGGRDRVSALRLWLTQGQVSVKLCQLTAAASLGCFRVQLCVQNGVGSPRRLLWRTSYCQPQTRGLVL